MIVKRGKSKYSLRYILCNRKSDNDITMECSPAYATTEFKTKLVHIYIYIYIYIEHITCTVIAIINNRSTVEPVYDTTGPETPTSFPPSTEYEVPTV